MKSSLYERKKKNEKKAIFISSYSQIDEAVVEGLHQKLSTGMSIPRLLLFFVIARNSP